MKKLIRVGIVLSLLSLGWHVTRKITHRPPKPEVFKQQVIDKALSRTVIIRANLSNGGAYIGAGVVIAPDGTILTVAHLTRGDGPITIITRNRKKYKAVVLAVDNERDLAILYPPLAQDEFKTIGIPDTNEVPVGTKNFIIGHPLAKWYTITTGRIKDNEFEIGENCYWDLVTTPINHGNSGGGMFNEKGELIGIVSAMYVYWFHPTIGVIIPLSECDAFIRENYRQIMIAKMMIHLQLLMGGLLNG